MLVRHTAKSNMNHDMKMIIFLLKTNINLINWTVKKFGHHLCTFTLLLSLGKEQGKSTNEWWKCMRNEADSKFDFFNEDCQLLSKKNKEKVKQYNDFFFFSFLVTSKIGVERQVSRLFVLYYAFIWQLNLAKNRQFIWWYLCEWVATIMGQMGAHHPLQHPPIIVPRITLFCLLR